MISVVIAAAQVTAVGQVRSLAQELPHAMGTPLSPPKKRKGHGNREEGTQPLLEQKS